MINVTLKPEPKDFDKLVRTPGQKFLATCPNPTQKQWATRSYWRKILKSLHSEYAGICSYSCHWMPFDTGADTVEHFRPKTTYPKEAYEWTNYRLVCQLLNARKRDDETVLDPFKVQNNWFTIEFPSLLVKPANDLKKTLRDQVEHTCEILGLNDDDTCFASRMSWVTEFCLGNINFAHLQKRAPFLAAEMTRQGYNTIAALKVVMKL